jgi:plastocyanin
MKKPQATMTGFVLLLGLLGACGGQGVANTEVEVGEFWISPVNHVLRAGTVELLVENYGDFSHTLVVSDASGTVIGATDLIGSEATTVLTVDLLPGSYTFTCRIVKGLDDGTFVDHYQQGMTASVKVSA